MPYSIDKDEKALNALYGNAIYGSKVISVQGISDYLGISRQGVYYIRKNPETISKKDIIKLAELDDVLQEKSRILKENNTNQQETVRSWNKKIANYYAAKEEITETMRRWYIQADYDRRLSLSKVELVSILERGINDRNITEHTRALLRALISNLNNNNSLIEQFEQMLDEKDRLKKQK